MHETIYTIPLTESLEQESECPFCYLENKLEEEQVKYALGPAMMEPDHRMLSNRLGYCRRHTDKMNAAKLALPLALVMDTRMDEVIMRLKSEREVLQKKSRFLKKKNKTEKALSVVTDLTVTCLVCDKISNTMSKFFYTFWYLYKKEPDFKARVLKSRGFCLPHFKDLLFAAKEHAGSKQEQYICELLDLEIQNLARNKQDVTGFISQFDYRHNKDDETVVKNAHQICGGKLAKF